MIRARPHPLVVFLVAVALPACAERPDEPKPAPVMAAESPQGGKDSIPAPRPIPPAPELQGDPSAGQQLFLKLQCYHCHIRSARESAPNLEGLFGTKVALQGGGTVIADGPYIRESILNPKAKVVEGWEPVMPSYEGHVTEYDLADLVAFLRSFKRDEPAVAPAPRER